MLAYQAVSQDELWSIPLRLFFSYLRNGTSIHLNVKFLKTRLANSQIPHSATGRDPVMILFTCRLLFGLPSVRYLPSLSYFLMILDNSRASFFCLSVRVSQPFKFVFMSSLWIFHDLCWQRAVFVRWTVSCIWFWIYNLNLQFLLWSLTLYPIVNHKKITSAAHGRVLSRCISMYIILVYSKFPTI